MKSLKHYITESQHWMHAPAEGDTFGIELADGTWVESYVMETADNCILLDATPEIVQVFEYWNLLSDQESEDSVILETMGYGTLVGEDEYDQYENGEMDEPKAVAKMFVRLARRGIDPIDIIVDRFGWGTEELDDLAQQHGFEDSSEWLNSFDQGMTEGDIDEAKYHGREVPLGKPMAGDVKKSKVYVKDPSTGNIKKVNFGDPNMRIKKSNPARRKSFRARHHCENPGSRLKARYWSCRAW